MHSTVGEDTKVCGFYIPNFHRSLKVNEYVGVYCNVGNTAYHSEDFVCLSLMVNM